MFLELGLGLAPAAQTAMVNTATEVAEQLGNLGVGRPPIIAYEVTARRRAPVVRVVYSTSSGHAWQQEDETMGARMKQNTGHWDTGRTECAESERCVWTGGRWAAGGGLARAVVFRQNMVFVFCAMLPVKTGRWSPVCTLTKTLIGPCFSIPA